jgi:nitrite reductase (NADH) large subunit
MRERILVIGNGMASVRFAEALVQHAPARFDLTIVGAEPQPGYNRVLLSALLAQDVVQSDIVLRDHAWYESNGIRLIGGDAVSVIDASAKTASLQSGQRLAFDHCIFATGSHAIRLPIGGMDKPGVVTFRDLTDVAAMMEAAVAGQKVAVIGGGLLGIEAAYGLAKRGADVTLVHVMDRLMERQLDAAAAANVRKALIRRGVKVMLQKQTESILGEAAVTGLAFADGTSIEADMIVCAVGIRPNADLARASGLAVGRGILVNDAMASSLNGFYAIGECAEHQGVVYGLVEPAYAQAEVLAKRLAGEQTEFQSMVLATNLKVSGLPVFSAGDFMGGGSASGGTTETSGSQTVTLEDRKTRSYRKLVLRDNRLVGCVLVGEADDALWYLDLIRRGTDVSSARRLLIHGRAFAESALAQSGQSQAA